MFLKPNRTLTVTVLWLLKKHEQHESLCFCCDVSWSTVTRCLTTTSVATRSFRSVLRRWLTAMQDRLMMCLLVNHLRRQLPHRVYRYV